MAFHLSFSHKPGMPAHHLHPRLLPGRIDASDHWILPRTGARSRPFPAFPTHTFALSPFTLLPGGVFQDVFACNNNLFFFSNHPCLSQVTKNGLTVKLPLNVSQLISSRCVAFLCFTFPLTGDNSSILYIPIFPRNVLSTVGPITFQAHERGTLRSLKNTTYY